ncbi:MAG: alpha/beta fold hydrolase [Isosphaeraceae bacterium]
MFFMPFNLLGMWFRGLFSIAILAGGIYLVSRWYDDSHVVERIAVPGAMDEAREDDHPPGERRHPASATVAVTSRRTFRFEPGWNRPTLELSAALALLVWATLGRLIGHGISILTLRPGTTSPPSRDASSAREGGGSRRSQRNRKRKARSRKRGDREWSVPECDEDPSPERTGEAHVIRRSDGSELRVECHGPPDAPPIVWTHGWGANSTEWYYQKRQLSQRFRLIVWDEPGLGLSKKPDNDDYSLENLAAALDAVLEFAGNRPAVLVGHSIGGMITLTYCEEYPQALGTRIAGLVLVHTTHTNPVRTTRMAWLLATLEKPVLIPLSYLTIGLWPLVWLMNWMSYFNGSAHRSTRNSSFAGNETWGQLDFVARFMPHARPDVLARGMLGMIAYDATEVLSRIHVPTLVVVGDKDSTTTPEAGEFIASRIPGAKLVTLSPAKHMGLIEHHDQFNQLVAEFVEACEHQTVKR